MPLRIDAIHIDDHILDKIETKHGVTYEEAEEACSAGRRHVRRDRDGLYQFFSQTDAGRYLLVVLADHGEGLWKIVTARSMTDQERCRYQAHRGIR